MRVLILGGGGREHALAVKISRSPLCDALYIAPGNPGTAQCGTNVALGLLDFKAIGAFAVQNSIDLVVVGPEEPLVKGLGDYFAAEPGLQHIHFVGPGAEGALLEGSKAFAKAFMKRHNIPTAAYRSFSCDGFEEAVEFLSQLPPPYVLKADGLAAGKGVVICSHSQEAGEVLEEMLCRQKFGEASKTVVIEEFLEGKELSVFVITDGKHYCMLPSAMDYKRVGEHNTGANTGGMGAVSPVPFASEALMKKIEQQVVIPTINGLKQDGIAYCGFVFFGLMIVEEQPYVIEYNVRLGDPEAEVVLPRLKTDLLELMLKCCTGRLQDCNAVITPETAVTVMLCSGGYPGTYETGMEISGLEKTGEAMVFYAGVTEKAGRMLTGGGRVMAVTALAETLEKARETVYKEVGEIDFKGKYFRRDIGKDLLK